MNGKRLAAHYVLLPDDRLLKQHYVELDDDNRLLGVFPFHREIANTVFYNGILMLSGPSEAVIIDLLERIDLLRTGFSADDCRRHRYIRRLG
ncbi:MAG: hypothetical protein LBB85_09175 [Dysgonamonadaceae bacterium]|jgi:hypothetical protein|nr:hypothetical protein [Dysgonamonadaceae bacterium]